MINSSQSLAGSRDHATIWRRKITAEDTGGELIGVTTRRRRPSIHGDNAVSSCSKTPTARHGKRMLLRSVRRETSFVWLLLAATLFLSSFLGAQSFIGISRDYWPKAARTTAQSLLLRASVDETESMALDTCGNSGQVECHATFGHDGTARDAYGEVQTW